MKIVVMHSYNNFLINVFAKNKTLMVFLLVFSALIYSNSVTAQTPTGFSNVTISANATTGGTWNSSPPYTFSVTTDNAVINVTELNNLLLTSTSGSITINTTNSNGTQNGDISIQDNISVVNNTNTAKSLVFNADGNITISSLINIGSTTNYGIALSLTAAGDILSNATINTNSTSGNGGAITLNANNITLNLNANLNTSGSTTGGAIGITAAAQLLIYSNITSTGTTRGGVTINQASGTGNTFDGQITGVIDAGAFAKSGSGILMLSGSNTYTGNTTITAGILNIQNSNALGTTAGGTTVSANAALQLQGGISVGAEALSINGSGVSATGVLRNISDNNSWGGNITLAGISQLSAEGNSTLTLGGIIGGTGSRTFTKLGTGTIFLNAANSYTGATTISAGILEIGNQSALSTTSALTISNGATLDINGLSPTISSISGAGLITSSGLGNITLTFSNAAATTFSGIIQNGIATSLGITKLGTSSLTLSGANTYTGLTTVSAGTLIVTNPSSLGTTASGTSVLSPATLQINGVTINGEPLSIAGVGSGTGALIGGSGTSVWGGDVAMTAATSIGATAAIAINGIISGSFALTKLGTNTLTLSGVNTYAGSTTVSAGTLIVTNGSSLGTTAAGTSVTSGAMLQLNGVSISGEALTINGTGVGSAGALSNVTGASSWTGSIVLGSSSSIGATATLTINGIISGATFGLTKVGTGILELNGANSYTGSTTISAGTLKLVAASAIITTSDVVMNPTTGNAYLDVYGASVTIGSLASSGAGTSYVTSTGGGDITLTISGTTPSIFAGIIEDGTATSLSIIKAGTSVLTLSGANTYKGLTTVSQGTLIVTNPSSLGTTAAGTSVTSGAMLQLNGVTISGEALTINGTGVGSAGALSNITTASTWTGNIILGSDASIGATAAITINGIISGSYALTKLGTSSLTLSGANTYTGLTTVSAGILKMGVTAAIQPTNDIVINSGASWDLNGRSTTIATIKGPGKITSSVTGLVTLTVSSTNDYIFDGIIENGTSTGLSVTKLGSNTLTLTGVNTFTGSTIISEGMLKLGAAGVVSNSSNLVFNGGTFFNNGFSETFNVLSILNNSTLILDSNSNSTLTFSNIGTIGTTLDTSKRLVILGYRGANSKNALDRNGALLSASSFFVRVTGALGNTVTSGLTQFGQIVTSSATNYIYKNYLYINKANLSSYALTPIRFVAQDDQSVYHVYNSIQASSFQIMPGIIQ